MVAALQTVPLSTHLGLEVHLDREALLSGARADELRALLVRHGLLRFPAIHFSDEEQAAFAQTLGPIVSAWDVSADRSVNADARMASYQKSSVNWHFDGFGVARPEFATIMTPRLLEDGRGGATDFANCYRAYDALPEEEKRAIDSLRVRHSFETTMRMVRPWPTADELADWQRGGRPHEHPLVWHHRSGRNSLLLGASAFEIAGMDPEEGRLLICRLNEAITRPDNVYRYEWRIGDLVIWDNTGTLHRAVPYADDSRRLMHRTTIAGDEIPV